MHTTIQDLGRFGYAGHGLSQGGAMDLQAHCWANRLLNNPVNQPTLEITIGMASFCAECDLMLAIALEPICRQSLMASRLAIGEALQ